MGFWSKLFGVQSIPETAKSRVVGMEVRIVQGQAANQPIFDRSKARLERLERQRERYIRKGAGTELIEANRAAIERHRLQMEVAAANMRVDQ